MASPTNPATQTVALIGNPNTGKSTIFSALVGVHQHVGNYPGVTVEKKTGRMDHRGRRYEFIDLPGLYSLAPRSRDEMVAVDVLFGRRKDTTPVDAVVCIAEAGNLQRNLYLLSQVLEQGLPTVLVVNMIDVAANHGISIDVERLADRLSIPVAATQANRRIGIEQLKTALAEAVDREPHHTETPFPEPFENEVSLLQAELAEPIGSVAAMLARRLANDNGPLPRCLLRRLLLDVGGYIEQALFPHGDEKVQDLLKNARARLAEAGCAVPRIETTARYDWATRMLEGVVTEPSHYKTTVSDRIDWVLTHRVWGMTIFILVMIVIFQSVFTWAAPLMELIDSATGAVADWVAARMSDGALRSMVVDGVIGGVGGVVIFLPQILILFLFIAVLEDCGYMARAAFLMDKMMTRVGLSGKSFIPMLCSFACAVPGVMATRVIENERDRLTTILVAPLMTCSARLPVYALLIAAFIPAHSCLGGLLTLQGLTLISLYLLGIVVAVLSALIFKRTILRGRPTPFLMELPSYKWPSPRVVFYRVVQRGWIFLHTAGTIILLVSIIVWAALYYPHNAAVVEGPFLVRQENLQAQLNRLGPKDQRREEISRKLDRIDRDIAGAYQRQSILGRMGRVIEPVVRPLGWDWRIGCAAIASFPAREVVVATLGVIYNLGEDIDPESQRGAKSFNSRLRSATWDDSDPPRKVFNVPVAMSIMVFFALCAQCAATLAVIRRETNSWRWPVFAFAYMTTLAYVGAFVTYQTGMWIGQ